MKEHDQVLEVVLESIKNLGYEVVRLDKRDLPDAFYIENGKPIAIEIATDQSKPYSRCSEFQGMLLVKGKSYVDDHKGQVYAKVFDLRKIGKSFSEIQNEIFKLYAVKLSRSTIHDWLRGKSAPRTIVIP